MLSDVAARASQAQIKPLVAGDPQRLGGYEVRGRIGSGGMGAVYLGATPNGRPLAIKVIHPERVGEQEFRVRFRREVAAATQVRSRQTAAVIDYDVDGPMPWLATEYVPGPTLAQVVDELGALPEPAVRELVAGVARALDAIHAEGLVHRDVKPANILLGPHGPVLLDLGIVTDPQATSLTTTGLQVGTPQYMSPEQALGRQVSPATDIWSLGAVAYVAATAQPPFGTGTSATIGMRVVNDRPALEVLPAGLRGLVAACLTQEPASRPAPSALLAAVTRPVEGTDLPLLEFPDPTGTHLRASTELRAAGETVPAAGSEEPAPGRPGHRRIGLVAGLIAAALVLVGGGVTAAAMWWPRDKEPVVVAEPSASTTARQAASSNGPTRPPSGSPSPKRSPSASPSSSPDRPSAPTSPQPADPPVDPAPQRFTGGAVSLPSEAAVGETITAKLSGVQPEPDGTRCTWSVGGAKREGLGACSYTVVEQDTGKPIEVQVTATRAGYEDHVVVGGPTSLVQGVLPTPVCSVKLVKITAEERWDAYCEVVQDPEATYQWCWYDHTLDAVIGRSECAVREDGHVYIVKARKGHLIQARVVVTRDGYRSREYVATAKAPDWN